MNWQGKPWITAKGYVRGRLPGHPFPRKTGLMYEHVAVMELHLGRKLEPQEHVHHRDENKRHNAIENLEVVEGDHHSRYHCQKQPRQQGRYVKPTHTEESST